MVESSGSGLSPVSFKRSYHRNVKLAQDGGLGLQCQPLKRLSHGNCQCGVCLSYREFKVSLNKLVRLSQKEK